MTDRIYSFDVFDTSLVRNLARPTDLFYLLAEIMLNNGDGITSKREEVEDFVRARKKAEKIARKNNQKEDIGIDDIYVNLRLPSSWKISCEAMKQEELRLEYQAVRPISKTKRMIDQLRQAGKRIIFISDMYLPERLIRQMLEDHGIGRKEDRIYVSGEIGLTKHSGRLFQYVLESERIKPVQLLHHGDNFYSDIRVPRGIGIGATLISDACLNRYEKYTLKRCQGQPSICSNIVGVSRAVRLMSDDGSQGSRAVSVLAANVVGPLLTVFVAWVARHAQRQGIERLYFVSRDGQILLKIAQRLSSRIPVPECRYLYGSRQSWFLPSVRRCNRKSLDWLIMHGQSKAPRHLLRKLNIEASEIEYILRKYNLHGQFLDEQLNKERTEDFWSVIEHSEVASLVEEKALSARQMTSKYFEQEGLLSCSKWAVVDLGWTLKCQRALKRILNLTGYKGNLSGYYLAVSNKRLATSVTGDHYAFVEQGNEKSECRLTTEQLFQNCNFVEQVFTIADHGTVTCYKEEGGRVIPLLKSPNESPRHKQFVTNLHDHILSYTEEIAKTRLLDRYMSEQKRTALLATDKFLSRPTRVEAESLAWIVIGDDQNESRSSSLARALTFKDIVSMTARSIQIRIGAKNIDTEYLWIEGSYALSQLWIKLLFWPIKTAREIILLNGFSRLGNWMPGNINK